MLDPRKAAEYEQSTMTLGEVLPPMWWRIYRGCIAQGFSEAQALELVKTYILAMAPR
jgi:hypothetical protein